MRVSGATDIYALGDATATKWAPTAQVASRQGRCTYFNINKCLDLANYFNNLGVYNDENVVSENLGPFDYNHLGTLAYIGNDRAIADLPGSIHVGGALTYYFWRSAYLSTLFAYRNRALVLFDWYM